MTGADLIAAIEASLQALEPVYRSEADESDLYEAALLALAVEAAKDAGGTILLTNDGTAPAPVLRFRRSPGNLWSGGFSYALVSFAGSPKQLEIHLGVFVTGASGVAHESDVVVLDRGEADRSRAGGVHPRRRGVVAAMEAKHYVASPGLGVGRAFLGLAQELGAAKCSLGFPAKMSSTLATLIARKPSECLDELKPTGPTANRFRALVDQSIRNWLA